MAKDSITHAALTGPPTEVPLVHFTTRQLLLFVAAASVVCMILVSLDGYSIVVFGLGIVLVAGHVLSTLIGSRLRAAADDKRQWELQQTPHPAGLVQFPINRREPLRPSQLQIRTVCSRVLWWFVGTASACGGLLGAGGIILTAGPNVGWPGILIAAISAAMMVGWGALIIAGVCGIARRSWRETGRKANDSRA